MAKKFSKQQKQKMRTVVRLLALFLCGVVVGLLLSVAYEKSRPRNLVWPIDERASVPSDLKNFLLSQNRCQNYDGSGQTGVGLWSVASVYDDSYAKISHGCSSELNSYLLANRVNGNWSLVDPVYYFGKTGQATIPLCTSVDELTIPAEVEPFCANKAGQAVSR